MKSKIKFLLTFMLIMCVFVGPVTTKADSSLIDLSVEIGNDGTITSGSDVPIEVSVKNLGSDLSGTVRVTVLADNYGTVAYEKTFSIAGNSEKVISMIIPADAGMSVYEGIKVAVLNNKGELEKSKIIDNIDFSLGSDVIVGTLTDDYNGISYFDGNTFDYIDFYGQTKIKEYNKDSFPDSNAILSICDYIIIDNYNTEVLSDDQIEALFQWVDDGGCLIVGTGSTYDKVLSGLEDKVGISANASKAKDIFIRNEFQKIECAELNIPSDYKYIIPDGGIYYKDWGMGSVSVLEFSLLEIEATDNYDNYNFVNSILGSAMSNNLANQLSAKAQLDYNLFNGYAILDAFSTMSDIGVPKGTRYNILYIIYIVVFIPGIYLVLKKINKRELLFPLMIATSFVFVILVVLFSLKYVVKDQQYATINVKQADGNSTNVDSYFMSINPSGKTVNINFYENVVSIAPVSMDPYSYSYSDFDDTPDYIIREGNEGYQLRYKPDKAFEINTFSSVVKDKALDGYDISITKSGTVVSGYVINNTQTNLEELVIYYNEMYYTVKDVEAGEKVSFKAADFSDSYSYDWLANAVSSNGYNSSNMYSIASAMSNKIIVPSNTAIVAGITRDYNIKYINGDVNESYTCLYEYCPLGNE